ncbi:ATP-binding protein [Streptomyces lancefieldiae]|uniref:Histidine kinase/HSP90-like ATPase domain-containing protein n=1 Tax=Streptomyces lancefieldiae TaxID=3075520 RepID=A0ABU3APG9_9ACTN|nr:hypothetical protein [Streptomyces sp. DSM 40712]MDT0611477.1 hypothetical protein [Streptomyces sp. DSM 40712]
MRFSSTRRGARPARRMAEHLLDAWGVPYDFEPHNTLTHVVAELCANAVQHGCVPAGPMVLAALDWQTEMRAVVALVKDRQVLEFQRVLLTGASDGRIPHQRIERYRLTRPDRHRQEEQRARSLMFVAAGPVDAMTGHR